MFHFLNSVFLFYLLYFYYCLFNKGSNNFNFEIEKSELGLFFSKKVQIPNSEGKIRTLKTLIFYPGLNMFSQVAPVILSSADQHN